MATEVPRMPAARVPSPIAGARPTMSAFPQRPPMDTHNYTVHGALAPRIAILESDDVNDLLRTTNGLHNFAALLRPFEDSVRNVGVTSVHLEKQQCSVFPLRFDPLDAFLPAPASNSSKSSSQHFNRLRVRPEDLIDGMVPYLNRKISQHSGKGKEKQQEGGQQEDWLSRMGPMTLLGKDDLDRDVLEEPVEKLTPWYAEFRDAVLSTILVAPIETFSHPVAFMMVVSSHNPDPIGAFKKLYESSSTSNSLFTARPYVDSTIMRYYVLLHDASAQEERGSLERSNWILESCRKSYGLNCSLVIINTGGVVDVQAGIGEESPGRDGQSIAELWERSIGEEGRLNIQGVELGDDGEEGPKLHMTCTSLDVDNRHSRCANGSATYPSSTRSAAAKGTQHISGSARYATSLSAKDVSTLASFVRVFAAQSLIPWMERSVQQWNTQLSESRKGLTNRLFGAGRRLFGSAASASSSAGGSSTGAGSGAYFASAGYYPASSNEAQTRRLADFAFILRDYSLAASTYELMRKDAANDRAMAMAGAAGAMAGLSSLMLRVAAAAGEAGTTAAKQAQKAEEIGAQLRAARFDFAAASAALLGQSNATAGASTSTAVREEDLHFSMLRITLLFYEAYRALQLHAHAANTLKHSAEASMDEISAAMLHEQAALMCLRKGVASVNEKAGLPPADVAAAALQYPSVRRASIHLLTAAHAYRQCGQRALAGRCFESANSFQPLHSWTAIDAHLQRELMQQAQQRSSTESGLRDSIQHLIGLLRSGYGSADEQAAYLQQLSALWKTLREKAESDGKIPQENAQDQELTLAQPLFDVARCTIIKSESENVVLVGAHAGIGPPISDAEEEVRWEEIRDAYISELFRNDHELGDNARKSLSRLEMPLSSPERVAQVGEPLRVRLSLQNSLACTISISSLRIHGSWQDEEMEAGESNLAETTVSEVTVRPFESRWVDVELVPKHAGKLLLHTITFILNENVPIRQALTKRGKRLNKTRAQKLEPTYAEDATLRVTITDARPTVALDVQQWQPSLLEGEEVKYQLSLRNISGLDVKHLGIFIQDTSSLFVAEADEASNMHEGAKVVVHNTLQPERLIFPRTSAQMQAGESSSLTLWSRGSSIGLQTARLLVVFLGADGVARCARYRFESLVQPVVRANCTGWPTNGKPGAWRILSEVHNLMHEDLEITNISISSMAWRLSGQQVGHHPITLLPAQSSRTTLKLTRVDFDTSKVDADVVSERLRKLIKDKKTDEYVPVIESVLHISALNSDALIARRFTESDKQKWRLARLAQEYFAIPAVERKKIYLLHEPHEIDLTLHWRVPGSGRSGTHHLFGIPGGPLQNHLLALTSTVAPEGKQPRSLYAQTAKEAEVLWRNILTSRLSQEENPIEVLIAAPRRALHDFESTSHLTIPISLSVHNHASARYCTVELQLHNLDMPW
ncbi:hypothetical protein K437DRAFT_267765 [Tilletiaria anomala UBC 951]|uniref:TPPC8 first Ig-like domain-containing protein n=1 Tax=Tilletiaria anomala (strain ATCC 24038 / CBS 436.72 / UBC 951) TaxID=1037660 RepID=A0A066W589_TILAU|nr:uncharacterized protein K437DRAFT_267765 [Tilletiaria anomala UBC 951]KDN47718.1 hypothetical protein K437DRAFT_267765 [Tilletiaria anomala UBC 951]